MEDSKVSLILDAARKRFAHYGLEKTTMNEIAADIGMSKAALYYYFQDKEQIFVAVVEQEVNEFVKTIESLIERPSKPSFKLRKFANLKNERLFKLRNLTKIENPGPVHYFNPLFDQLRTEYGLKERILVQRILELGVAEGQFIKFNIQQYAELFVNSLNGLRMNLWTTKAGADESVLSNQTSLFLDIFLRGIQASPESAA